SPNALTIVGLLISVAAAAAIAVGYVMAGGVVLLAAGLFDMLDGALARASNRVTRFGALLDSTADRVAEAAVFGGLAWRYVGLGDAAGVMLAFAALVASFLVSYLRARSEGLGVQGDVGIAARPERVILLALGLLSGLVKPALALVAALAFVTAGQRLAYAAEKARDTGPSTDGPAS
ncbi:MAG: CDP-alcohol phosphatidyltransferase family protein, partial [Dehalococcoidia bacterium]|nr:CDP-alcohol phosphatidyltransferase family protein [Dehalococcoidia bacterium]